MRVLRYSDRGPAVQLLQLALERASFGPLARDGIFGARTQEALLRFQRSRGLAADGVAGRATHEALLPWYTGFVRHRVRAGESFFSVARLYGASPEAVELANSVFRPEELPVGATITVPLPFAVVTTDIDCCTALVTYCVRGLCARYPFLAGTMVGRSVLGRPLWSLTLGAGENRVLYSAAHHANEWITATLLLSFAEELCESFARGGAVFGRSAAEILDYARLCLVPLVDPDGVDLVTGELVVGEAYESARRIASCSAAELITCFPFRRIASAPERSAQLSLSEPQEVKTSSSGRQPNAFATAAREQSSSFFASLPAVWVELGFPKMTVIAFRAACAASGQTCVVAELSR